MPSPRSETDTVTPAASGATSILTLPAAGEARAALLIRFVSTRTICVASASMKYGTPPWAYWSLTRFLRAPGSQTSIASAISRVRSTARRSGRANTCPAPSWLSISRPCASARFASASARPASRTFASASAASRECRWLCVPMIRFEMSCVITRPVSCTPRTRSPIRRRRAARSRSVTSFTSTL